MIKSNQPRRTSNGNGFIAIELKKTEEEEKTTIEVYTLVRVNLIVPLGRKATELNRTKSWKVKRF